MLPRLPTRNANRDPAIFWRDTASFSGLTSTCASLTYWWFVIIIFNFCHFFYMYSWHSSVRRVNGKVFVTGGNVIGTKVRNPDVIIWLCQGEQWAGIFVTWMALDISGFEFDFMNVMKQWLLGSSLLIWGVLIGVTYFQKIPKSHQSQRMNLFFHCAYQNLLLTF